MDTPTPTPEEGKARRTPGLLNRAHVKRYLLERAKKTGRTKFTRVSKGTLGELEAKLRVMCDNRVHSTTGKGKTL